jgi:hypothetical protein
MPPDERRMNTKLPLKRLCLAATTLLLSSCLDYEEEMWLEHDLSGRVMMTVAVSGTLADLSEAGTDQLTLEKLRQMIASTEGLSVESADSFRENGKQVSRITIQFEDVRRLGWLAASSKEPAWVIGVIAVEEKEGQTTLRRTLGPFTTEAAGTSRQQSALTRGFSGLLLGSYSLTYKLHLPEEPVSADSMQIDRKNKTVRWRFPLGQLVSGTGTMSVNWESGGSRVWWGLLLMLAGGAVFGWWRWQTAKAGQ